MSAAKAINEGWDNETKIDLYDLMFGIYCHNSCIRSCILDCFICLFACGMHREILFVVGL